ncbi:RICIN domain-containing protein [Nonomuraea sp. CA-143628]|uniref:RICIN domain-containing protein n=1 Tax=Nonomuraea sp. CA-143628 TaxID=3239997 RepID=UPI003D8D474D
MFKTSLKAAKTIAAIGAVSAAALLAGTGSANAASGFNVRLSPVSNPFLFVDVAGGATGDGAKIIQWPLSGDNQIWQFQPVGSHFQIVNRHSGKCITSDGGVAHQLYQWRCKGTDQQLWDTNLNPGNLIGYPITNVASGLVMDVMDASGAQGAAIDTWYYHNGNNQAFVGSSAD